MHHLNDSKHFYLATKYFLPIERRQSSYIETNWLVSAIALTDMRDAGNLLAIMHVGYTGN